MLCVLQILVAHRLKITVLEQQQQHNLDRNLDSHLPLGRGTKCGPEKLAGVMETSCVLALTAVAQWVGQRLANQKVTISIPSQAACLGFGPGPHLGARERQPHIDVSLTPPCLSLSPSFPLSLKINK